MKKNNKKKEEKKRNENIQEWQESLIDRRYQIQTSKKMTDNEN